MNIAEATAAVRIHHQWLPDELQVERGLTPDTIRLLEHWATRSRYTMPGARRRALFAKTAY